LPLSGQQGITKEEIGSVAFDGFSGQTVDYLRDLAANNSRDWFQDNRHRYDDHVMAPALALIEDLAPFMAALDPACKAEARLNGSFRRLNRDVRFSKDKRPYSPRLHLIFWTGDHPNRSPGLHFVLSDTGFGFGCGNWVVDADQLAAFRQAVISSPGTNLVKALDMANLVGCRLGEPDLKKVPKGIDEQAPFADLTRYKGVVARTFDEDSAPGHPDELFTNSCSDHLRGICDKMHPLNRWLMTHVYA
jgi:uncharacterized protein (TIGR02453 family)